MPESQYGAWDGNLRAKALTLITFSEGSTQTVVTDSTWKTYTSGTVATLRLLTTNSSMHEPKHRLGRPPLSMHLLGLMRFRKHQCIRSSSQHPLNLYVLFKPFRQLLSPIRYPVYGCNFGQNIAGIGAATLDEDANTVVTMHYGEQLSSGRVYDEGGRVQLSTYVSAGTGSLTWHPRFTYYGFDISSLRALLARQIPAQ